MSKFKIDDKVTFRGHTGRVTGIMTEQHYSYPIFADFPDMPEGRWTFTEDGRLYESDTAPSLFHFEDGSETFEDAKVGDRVYCLMYGWGAIYTIDCTLTYPVMVKFDNGRKEQFSTYGEFDVDSNNEQVLFWDVPAIEAPKRKAPKFKEINGLQVPNLSIRPEHNECYNLADPCNPLWYYRTPFEANCEISLHRADKGLCYPNTDEGIVAAIAHAKALLGIKDE